MNNHNIIVKALRESLPYERECSMCAHCDTSDQFVDVCKQGDEHAMCRACALELVSQSYEACAGKNFECIKCPFCREPTKSLESVLFEKTDVADIPVQCYELMKEDEDALAEFGQRARTTPFAASFVLLGLKYTLYELESLDEYDVLADAAFRFTIHTNESDIYNHRRSMEMALEIKHDLFLTRASNVRELESLLEHMRFSERAIKTSRAKLVKALKEVLREALNASFISDSPQSESE